MGMGAAGMRQRIRRVGPSGIRVEVGCQGRRGRVRKAKVCGLRATVCSARAAPQCTVQTERLALVTAQWPDRESQRRTRRGLLYTTTSAAGPRIVSDYKEIYKIQVASHLYTVRLRSRHERQLPHTGSRALTKSSSVRIIGGDSNGTSLYHTVCVLTNQRNFETQRCLYICVS